MATIAIEFGKLTSKKTREVYLLVRQGKSRRRVKTGVKLAESEYSEKTGKIKTVSKARAIEKLKGELEENLEAVEQNVKSVGPSDGEYVTKQIIKKQEVKTMDFFSFTEGWLARTNIKSVKNYKCMLNTLAKFNGSRKLPFNEIDVSFLKRFESHLEERPRAKTMYLGLIRHLFREAMIEFNTDDETVIKSDPFRRYKAPKQVMKKGVRALSLEDFMKIVNYQPHGAGRALLAHDCFILSFCLMGINSVDLYNVKKLEHGILKYNRTKTKDRRSDDAYIEVRIHPFIKKLMAKWKGTGGYVFNFRKRFKHPEDFNRSLNVGLKTIGDELHMPGLARDFVETTVGRGDSMNIQKAEEFKTSKFFCKTDFDMEKIKQEESEYQELPKFYNFKSRDERERILYANFNQVTEDVNKMVKDLQQFFKRT